MDVFFNTSHILLEKHASSKYVTFARRPDKAFIAPNLIPKNQSETSLKLHVNMSKYTNVLVMKQKLATT